MPKVVWQGALRQRHPRRVGGPGLIGTPVLGQVPEEHSGHMTSRIPPGWLASEETPFSTGAGFDLSGGWAVD